MKEHLLSYVQEQKQSLEKLCSANYEAFLGYMAGISNVRWRAGVVGSAHSIGPLGLATVQGAGLMVSESVSSLGSPKPPRVERVSPDHLQLRGLQQACFRGRTRAAVGTSRPPTAPNKSGACRLLDSIEHACAYLLVFRCAIAIGRGFR